MALIKGDEVWYIQAFNEKDMNWLKMFIPVDLEDIIVISLSYKSESVL